MKYKLYLRRVFLHIFSILGCTLETAIRNLVENVLIRIDMIEIKV